MGTVKPRLAIAYHFFNEEGTRSEMERRIRETYDGPLTLAEDMLVGNITKDDIRIRKAVSRRDHHPRAPLVTTSLRSPWANNGRPSRPANQVPRKLLMSRYSTN